MPNNPRKTIKEQVTHGEHLTWVDKLRSSVQPKEEQAAYLTEAAKRNKDRADAEIRQRAESAKRNRHLKD